MAGFAFSETMSGSYRLDASPMRERAMSFTVGVRVDAWSKFLRDRIAAIQGAIEMEGFAAHRPLRGTMELDPILGRRIGYAFDFVDDQGRPHRFAGRKDVDFFRPLETMTTLPGEILDGGGQRVGEARLRFDARADLVRFLRSFRGV
jgi:hypothetical protein